MTLSRGRLRSTYFKLCDGTPMMGFKAFNSVAATLSGIETIRTIKRGHIYDKQPGVKGEIQFVEKLFPARAASIAAYYKLAPTN